MWVVEEFRFFTRANCPFVISAGHVWPVVHLLEAGMFVAWSYATVECERTTVSARRVPSFGGEVAGLAL